MTGSNPPPHARHVGCLGCGAGLALDGDEVQTCTACGRRQRLDEALQHELAHHRQRLDDLAGRSSSARFSAAFTESMRLGWLHVGLLASLLAVLGVSWASELVVSGLSAVLCPVLGIAWLVVVGVTDRRILSRLRARAVPDGPPGPQQARCPTCGGPTLAGSVSGAPCPSCGTPVLAASEVLDALRERQEAAVAAEEAIARSLGWQLQARTHRHRREDLAPWIAFVLCFGAIPAIGPVAIIGGYLAGNWTLAGAAVGLSAVWRSAGRSPSTLSSGIVVSGSSGRPSPRSMPWPARVSEAGLTYRAPSEEVRRTRPSELGRWVPGDPIS